MLSSREPPCFYHLKQRSFPSYHYHILQDAQNYDENTKSGIKPTHSEEEDKFSGKKKSKTTHFDSRARRVF